MFRATSCHGELHGVSPTPSDSRRELPESAFGPLAAGVAEGAATNRPTSKSYQIACVLAVVIPSIPLAWAWGKPSAAAAGDPWSSAAEGAVPVSTLPERAIVDSLSGSLENLDWVTKSSFYNATQIELTAVQRAGLVVLITNGRNFHDAVRQTWSEALDPCARALVDRGVWEREFFPAEQRNKDGTITKRIRIADYPKRPPDHSVALVQRGATIKRVIVSPTEFPEVAELKREVDWSVVELVESIREFFNSVSRTGG